MNQICKICKKKSETEICLECSKPKPKFYYDVKIETMLPATLTYRILAEDPQQAVDLIKKMQPNSVSYKLIGRKDLKLRVYEAGCSIIKLMLNILK